MLNWEGIDNEKVFQRLVNHLFALECNSPGFIPSSPYIRADEKDGTAFIRDSISKKKKAGFGQFSLNGRRNHLRLPPHH